MKNSVHYKSWPKGKRILLRRGRNFLHINAENLFEDKK